MFMFHAALALGLIALTAGTALFAWSKHANTAGSGFAKFIGIIVILFALASTTCTIYCGVKYWQQGGFQHYMGMHGGMMDKCMNNCKMMSGSMTNSTPRSQ